MTNDYIKVCPYCPRYRNCRFDNTKPSYLTVDERKQEAYNCLLEVLREESQGIYEGEPFLIPYAEELELPF